MRCKIFQNIFEEFFFHLLASVSNFSRVHWKLSTSIPATVTHYAQVTPQWVYKLYLKYADHSFYFLHLISWHMVHVLAIWKLRPPKSINRKKKWWGSLLSELYSSLLSHYKYFVDTCANVVLSCSCRAFNTFCTDGTTAFLTSALTALSNFPDRVVVRVCDRVLCSCSCLFLSPECFSRRAFSRRWAKLLVKETWFYAIPLGIAFKNSCSKKYIYCWCSKTKSQAWFHILPKLLLDNLW